MAFKVRPRVKVATTTTGTGSYALGAALDGFQSFGALDNGDTTFYYIEGAPGSGLTAWEVGIGTYSTSGPTLARTTVLASSTGSAIDWGAGTKHIGIGEPGIRSLWNLAAGLVKGDGAGQLAAVTLSAFIEGLLDDADAAAARATLGLGTAATANTGTGDGNVPALASGGLDLAEKELLRVLLKDIAEKTQVINHSSSGALSINYENGPCVIVNQSANITSMSVTGLPPAGAVAILLEFRKDNSGTARTVVWISGFTTPGGAAVTKTQTANAVDRYLLSAQDASSPAWRVDTLGMGYKVP